MREKILLEIILGEKNSSSEFVVWTEHKRSGTIDECRRGEIVTQKLPAHIRGRLSNLARAVLKRNSEREDSRVAGTFGITDEEYVKKQRSGEIKDSIHTREMEAD